LQKQNPIINWKTGKFQWQTYVPDIKNTCRLSEQQWKNKKKNEGLKEIPKAEKK
jgi:hypothetical protein